MYFESVTQYMAQKIAGLMSSNTKRAYCELRRGLESKPVLHTYVHMHLHKLTLYTNVQVH